MRIRADLCFVTALAVSACDSSDDVARTTDSGPIGADTDVDGDSGPVGDSGTDVDTDASVDTDVDVDSDTDTHADTDTDGGEEPLVLPRWRQMIVASGRSHTCGIQGDATLWCWGENHFGELGDGTREERGEPVEVLGDLSWLQVTAGRWHTCAIAEDRAVWCWGWNYYGQVGNFREGAWHSEPVYILRNAKWLELASGRHHTCGIREDRSLWCWGRNREGQIGDGTKVHRRPWATPVVGDDAWLHVTAGAESSCAIRDDDTLWCWGGIAEDSPAAPVQVLQGTYWRQVSAGTRHTCAIRDDDSLWCWGNNHHGQLGDGTRVNAFDPRPVAGGGHWRTVAAGNHDTCAIRTDDSLWCWGANVHGQIGDGTTEERTTPTRVATGRRWLAVSTHGVDDLAHTCALDLEDESMWCWGSNERGQLGDGTTVERHVPVPVEQR